MDMRRDIERVFLDINQIFFWGVHRTSPAAMTTTCVTRKRLHQWGVVVLQHRQRGQRQETLGFDSTFAVVSCFRYKLNSIKITICNV